MSDSLSLSQKVVRNTGFNILGWLWNIMVVIFLTPYIIQHIGIDRFGVWAVIGVITGYFGLLDFGVSTSYIKHIAEYNARHEYEKISSLVNVGFVFYSLFGIIIFAVLCFFIGPLMVLLKIPADLSVEARFVFLAGTGLFLLGNAVSAFYSIQIGLQRMDLANKVAIIVSAVNIAGTVLFLEKGYGLTGLIINSAIVFILSSVINITIAFKIVPEFRLSIFFFDPGIFKKLFKFGLNLQMSKVYGVVSAQTDKILILFFLSISYVTFYHLGCSLIYYATTVSSLLVSALMPAFSELQAKGERKVLIEAYFKSTKYLTFIVAPLFVFLAVYARRLVFVWMGTGYDGSALIIQILALAWVVNTVFQIAGSVCIAVDRTKLLLRSSVIMISAHIIFSFFLIKTYGFHGVAWGTVIAVNSGTIYFMFLLHKELDAPLFDLVSKISPYFLASAISAGVVYGFSYAIEAYLGPFNRLFSLILLFIQAMVYLAVYLKIIHLARYYSADDIDFFEKRFPRISGIIRLAAAGRGQPRG